MKSRASSRAAAKKRARSASVRDPSLPDIGEKEVEALTVAMIVAPGVYVRNRMFDLFASPGAARARARAAIVRGVIAQLARATAVSLSSEPRGDETFYVLRYRISSMRLTRVVDLSETELAALRLVAERANLRVLPPADGDRQLVARALASLLSSSMSTLDARRGTPCS